MSSVVSTPKPCSLRVGGDRVDGGLVVEVDLDGGQYAYCSSFYAESDRPGSRRHDLPVPLGVPWLAYSAKFPKATAKVTGELETLLAFYDCPAEHCRSGCRAAGRTR